MKRFLLLLLLAGSAHAQVTMDLKWLKASGLPEVRDDACYVAVLDRDERDRAAMHNQAVWCKDTGKPLVSPQPPAGSIRVTWAEYDDQDELAEAYWLAYGRRIPVGQAAGFAVLRDGRCYVHTERGYNAFGHEVKHCLEGEWHPLTHMVQGRLKR